jgi:hypothetical protein
MAIPLRAPATRERRAVVKPTPLAVVPGRRRVAWFAVGLTVLIGVVLIGVVLLHTRLAERQLRIDELERAVRVEQEQFDVLRAQRAELRSPTRLAVSAGALGMSPGEESQFIAVDPMVLAVTIARTGELPNNGERVEGSNARLRPLDQFRIVKSLNAEAP